MARNRDLAVRDQSREARNFGLMGMGLFVQIPIVVFLSVLGLKLGLARNFEIVQLNKTVDGLNSVRVTHGSAHGGVQKLHPSHNLHLGGTPNGSLNDLEGNAISAW